MNEKRLAIQRNRQPFLHCALFPIAAPKPPHTPGENCDVQRENLHRTPGAIFARPPVQAFYGVETQGSSKAAGIDVTALRAHSPLPAAHVLLQKRAHAGRLFLFFFVPFCPSKREATAVKRAHHSFTPSCFGVRPARAVTGRMALKKRNSSTASSGHMPMFLTRLLAR